jgi:hypothetical protein
MSDRPDETPAPPALENRGTPGKRKSGLGALFLGAVLCFILLLTVFLGIGVYGLVVPPAVGLALLAKKTTRTVGVGVVLTYGCLWLIFLAICGRGSFWR